MPVLNRQDTIEKALQSVIQQSYLHYELIILDGGSTDGTLDKIKQYASHIQYWHSEYDGSPVVAINKGVEKASGDIIAILMADDWYEPETLKRLADAYIEQPSADILTCGGRIVAYDETTKTYSPKWIYATPEKLALSWKNICFTDTSAICCRFIKKDFYQRIGLYQPFDKNNKAFFSNDKEWLMRAVLHQAKNYYIPYMGHNYLAHAGSMTFGNHRSSILKLCEEHMQIADTYLAKSGLTFLQKMQLHYWYCDQAVRLFVYQLIDGKRAAALATAKLALKRYHFFLPLAVCLTTLRIVRKKWRDRLDRLN